MDKSSQISNYLNAYLAFCDYEILCINHSIDVNIEDPYTSTSPGEEKLKQVFSLLKILRVVKIARHSTGIQAGSADT